MEWLSPLISGISAIFVAVIGVIAAKERKCYKEEQSRVERRAKMRAEESRLSMELMSASCALSLITARKLSGAQMGEEVREAISKAELAQKNYNAFHTDVVSRQVVNS